MLWISGRHKTLRKSTQFLGYILHFQHDFLCFTAPVTRQNKTLTVCRRAIFERKHSSSGIFADKWKYSAHFSVRDVIDVRSVLQKLLVVNGERRLKAESVDFDASRVA